MISRREFVKFTGIAGVAALGGALATSCGEARGASSASSASAGSSSGSSSPSSGSSSSSTASSSRSSSAAASAEVKAEAEVEAASAGASGKTLVAYFSHVGENYGVGVISEGNTAIVADMIASKLGADRFEIVPTSAYPQGYDECCDVALEEKNAAARPALAADFAGFDGYDTVYLGYPIWWGDMPMAVYTFIEAHDWAGKTVYPFSTHAGSGLANTESALESACTGAAVQPGFTIAGTTAQGSRGETEAAVGEWLDA